MKLVKYFFVLLVLLFSSLSWAGSVNLEWDPNTEPDIAGYKIYYKIGSSGEPYNGTGAVEGDSPVDVGNVTTFEVSGLTEGNVYYFVATAYNTGALESDYSNEVSTSDITDLYPPTVTGTTPTNDTTPTWSWSSGGGGNGTYRYKLDDSDLTSGATQTTNTSYTPAVALSEGSHTLYVQERDVDENWSNSGSFTIVVDITAPEAPSNLDVTVLSEPNPEPILETLVSGPGDIWDNVYEPTWIYQVVSGDFDVSIRLTVDDINTPWEMAGILFEAGLGTNNVLLCLQFSGSYGYHFQRRDTVNNDSVTSNTNGDGVSPCWLRMKREGEIFTCYYAISEDSWIEIPALAGSLISSVNGDLGVVALHPDGDQFTIYFERLLGWD